VEEKRKPGRFEEENQRQKREENERKQGRKNERKKKEIFEVIAKKWRTGEFEEWKEANEETNKC
jgi:hypothetical protein